MGMTALPGQFDEARKFASLYSMRFLTAFNDLGVASGLGPGKVDLELARKIAEKRLLRLRPHDGTDVDADEVI
jgi:hypothetical protein